MNKGNQTVKKVFTVIGNIIIWLFVIFATVITILTFASQSSEDGVPSIGKTTILTVSTDSMVPKFEKGDIILGKKLLPDEQTTLKVDDIITYDAGDLDGNGTRDLNSHRIVEVVKGDKGAVSYITKGDNVLVNDKDPVEAQNVICKYTGTRIKGVGKVLNFLQTPKGFMICIVIPLILFFMFELIRFIKRYLEIKSAGKAEITAEDEERIRKQAVEEYLRSQDQASDQTVNETTDSDE